ncbi:hypothetical protein SK128_016199, partial [Halocaridina rubra]
SSSVLKSTAREENLLQEVNTFRSTNNEDETIHKAQEGTNLPSGGGVARAAHWLLALVPMLASRMASFLGLSRRRRELDDDAASTSSDKSIPQQHLEIVQNLNRYYSSLNNSSVPRPTPDQLKLHKKYLLNLLEDMKRRNKSEIVSSEDRMNDTESALPNSRILPSSDEWQVPSSPNLTAVPPDIEGIRISITNNKKLLPKEHMTKINTLLSSESLADEKLSKTDDEDSHFLSKVGQMMTENSELQDLDVDKFALLLSHMQGQDDVKIFSSNFFKKLTEFANNPQHHFNHFLTNHKAPSELALTLNTANAINSPGITHMEQLPKPVPASTFQSDLPIHATFQSGVRPIKFDLPFGDYMPSSLIIEEPNNFADLSLNSLQSNNHVTAEPISLASSNPLGSTVNPEVASFMEQNVRPVAAPQDIQNISPLSFFPGMFQNAMKPAEFDIHGGENIPSPILLGDPGPFSNYHSFTSGLEGDNQLHTDPNIILVDGVHFQDLSVLGSSPLSSSVFNVSDPVPATFLNTQATTQLADALTDFFTNIINAINALITDLQMAIQDNPALAFLLLLPLLLLPLFLQLFGVMKHHQRPAPSRLGRSFLPPMKLPLPSSVSSTKPSLTAANIDPISGHHFQSPSFFNAQRVFSEFPSRFANMQKYDKTNPSVPQVAVKQPTTSPNRSGLQSAQSRPQSIENEPNISQPSHTHDLPIASGTSSILDKLPNKDILMDPQNIPDVIEGLSSIAASGQTLPPNSFADLIQNLPIEFFLNSNLYSEYDAIINALRIFQQQNLLHGGNKDTTTSIQPHSLVELTQPDSQTVAQVEQVYDPGYFQQHPGTLYSVNPQGYPVRRNPVPNVRLTTELNTAFQNLVDNVVQTISTFLTDLADAITASPALLLLGLIPFTILILSLYHHYGAPHKSGGFKGGGGGYGSNSHNTYGRNSFKARQPYEDADELARKILHDIHVFERWVNA